MRHKESNLQKMTKEEIRNKAWTEFISNYIIDPLLAIALVGGSCYAALNQPTSTNIPAPNHYSTDETTPSPMHKPYEPTPDNNLVYRRTPQL